MPWSKVCSLKGIQGNIGPVGPASTVPGPVGPIGLTGASPARYAKRLATNASGIVDVTFPAGLFSGIPVVSADVETPVGDITAYSYKCEMVGAPTPTTCKIKVTRQSLSIVVSLLGSLITVINAAPAGVMIDVVALDQST